jgi:hypothetical protein
MLLNVVGACGPKSNTCRVQIQHKSWVKALGIFLILHHVWPPSHHAYLKVAKGGSTCAGKTLTQWLSCMIWTLDPSIADTIDTMTHCAKNKNNILSHSIPKQIAHYFLHTVAQLNLHIYVSLAQTRTCASTNLPLTSNAGERAMVKFVAVAMQRPIRLSSSDVLFTGPLIQT